MELDHNKIKEFLIVLTRSDNPIINTQELMDAMFVNQENQQSFNIFYNYLKILNEQEYIECINDSKNNLGITFTGRGEPIISIKNFRITTSGNEALRVMNSNKFKEKINKILKTIGIEGLKQIPALIVKNL